MIKHIVFWTFKDHADGHDKNENVKRVVEALRALPKSISEIVEFEVGVDEISGPASFDVSLTSAFNSWEEFETYKVHPAHVKVVELVGKLIMNRAVVDYTL